MGKLNIKFEGFTFVFIFTSFIEFYKDNQSAELGEKLVLCDK